MPLAPFQKKMAKIHDKIFSKIEGKLLQPYSEKTGDSKLYVLKTDGTTKPFKILAVIENYRAYNMDEGFGHRRVFEIADTGTNYGADGTKTFPEVCRTASHVAVIPFGEVYSVRNSIDGVQLVYADFTYKIYGEQMGTEKFVLEENA